MSFFAMGKDILRKWQLLKLLTAVFAAKGRDNSPVEPAAIQAAANPAIAETTSPISAGKSTEKTSLFCFSVVFTR